MRTWTTLDRVVRVEVGKSAQAVRNVTNTLSVLDSHFPRFPVLPGVLILGSLAELASLLLREQTGREWQMVGAEQVRFRQFVQPGDQMELAIEIKEVTPDMAVCSGAVRVEGKLTTTARQIRLVPLGVAETGAAA